MNIHDAEGIQEFLDDIGLSVDRKRPIASLAAPRYNIAPSAPLATVTRAGPDDPRLQLLTSHWGIVPSWAKTSAYSRPLINARSETVFEKRSFKHLIRNQRAVVPVNGFYEWQRGVKPNQPWHFKSKEQAWIAIAAIWESSGAGEPQVCLLTTEANQSMAPIHHRMPVLLDAHSVKPWLFDDDQDDIAAHLHAPGDDALTATKVSEFVNNARNDGPRCIEPLTG